MKRLALFVAAAAFLASTAGGEDDPDPVLSLAIDKDGHIVAGDAKLAGDKLDAAISEAARKLQGTPGGTSELEVRVTAVGDAPFGSFMSIFKSARKAGVYRFQLVIDGKFVSPWFSRDLGVGVGPPLKLLRLHLCSSGDAGDHAKAWSEHNDRLKALKPAEKTWVWLEGEEDHAADVGADEEALSKAAKAIRNAADPKEEKDRRKVEICADANVPLKVLFRLFSTFLCDGAKSVEEVEKRKKSGEPVDACLGPCFEFTLPKSPPK